MAQPNGILVYSRCTCIPCMYLTPYTLHAGPLQKVAALERAAEKTSSRCVSTSSCPAAISTQKVAAQERAAEKTSCSCASSTVRMNDCRAADANAAMTGSKHVSCGNALRHTWGPLWGHTSRRYEPWAGTLNGPALIVHVQIYTRTYIPWPHPSTATQKHYVPIYTGM